MDREWAIRGYCEGSIKLLWIDAESVIRPWRGLEN